MIATERSLRAIDAATLPYPGFPTDLQPFVLAYDAVAEGSGMVTENLFEARFRTVQELARLGADVRVDGHHAMVHGKPRLSAAPVEASDIRAGAALVVAGLVADGVTRVSGAHHVDRGYARFDENLRALGADVRREADPPRPPGRLAARRTARAVRASSGKTSTRGPSTVRAVVARMPASTSRSRSISASITVSGAATGTSAPYSSS